MNDGTVDSTKEATNSGTRPPDDGAFRYLRMGDIQWRVFEYVASYDRRVSSSLIFASDDVVRRIRDFPANWRTLDDESLGRISESGSVAGGFRRVDSIEADLADTPPTATARPGVIGAVRQLSAGGVAWSVFEYMNAASESTPSLIFESAGVMRRVVDFPADWGALDDAALLKVADYREVGDQEPQGA